MPGRTSGSTDAAAGGRTASISRWKEMLFAIFICLAFFGLLELVLWAAGVPTLIEREDPFRGFSGLMPVFQRQGDVYRTRPAVVGVTFNEQSFLADKPAGGLRMFCIGGSSSWGFPWGAKVAFTSIIGEAVAASHPGLQVEAVNASGISYAMHRMNIVADELAGYKPDIFLVYEGHNEFIEPAFFEKLKHRSSVRNRVEYWLAHWRLYSLMWFGLEKLKRRQPLNPEELDATVQRDQTRTFSKVEKAEIIAEFRWRLERLVHRAQSDGIKVLLATVPCNLRAWSPEGSAIENVNDEDSKKWERSFLSGKKRLRDSDWAGACADLAQAARIAPGHAETQFLLGKAYEAVKAWDDARLAYERACDADIKPIRRLSGINDVIRSVALESGALLVDVDKIFEQHSEHGLVGFNLIEDYVHPTREGHELIAWHMWQTMEQAGWFKGKTQPERALFDKLIAERRNQPIPENPRWLANQAHLLQKQGRDQEAIEKYRECLVKVPDFGDVMMNLGMLLLKSGKIAEAVDMYERLVKIDPKNHIALTYLGQSLQSIGRTNDAITRFEQAVSIQPDYPRGHSLLGLSLAQAGRFPQAIAHLEQAVHLEPNDAQAHCNFGIALAMEGKIQDAIGQYEQALRIDPDYVVAHVQLGMAFHQMDKLPEAAAHYEQALRINPQDTPAAINLAKILFLQGRMDEAAATLEKVLKANPQNVDAYDGLGYIWDQQGKGAEALACWRAGLRLNPDNVSIMNNIAWLLATSPEAKLRNGKEAVAVATKAMQIAGASEPALLETVAAAYAEAGQFSEAIKTAEKALALASTGKEQAALADGLRARLTLYKAGSPFHVKPPVTQNLKK
jgi:tetratricopeptide (TPR) repeat protein